MRCSRPRHPACRQRWTVAEAATEEGRKGKGRALTLSGVRALRKRSIAQANRHTEDEHKEAGRDGEERVERGPDRLGCFAAGQARTGREMAAPDRGPVACDARAFACDTRRASAADRNEVRTL